MIVGFPGETEAEFEDTLSLIEAVRYNSIFSFKYSERPNTLASKRLPDDVPEEVKTRRIRGLQLLQRRIQLALHEGAVGQRSKCWSTRAAGAATGSSRGGRPATRS